MKRRNKSNGHSFEQAKLFKKQQEKDGINPRDKVWFKFQKKDK